MNSEPKPLTVGDTLGRIDRLAGILYRHARQGGDVGDLLAAAARKAAARLADQAARHDDFVQDGDVLLVAGRPGSWEAEHVLALAGGWEHETKTALEEASV